MTHVGLEHYLVISALLFALGLLGVLTRRSLLVMYMSLELMLNAANLALENPFCSVFPVSLNHDKLVGPFGALVTMEVWLGDIPACHLRFKKEVVSLSKIFVGVDVSKEFSTAQGIDDKGEKICYLRFAMNAGWFL